MIQDRQTRLPRLESIIREVEDRIRKVPNALESDREITRQERSRNQV